MNEYLACLIYLVICRSSGGILGIFTEEGLVTISQTKQLVDGYGEVFVDRNTRSFAGSYSKTDLA
jgi:hypothetical protein